MKRDVTPELGHGCTTDAPTRRLSRSIASRLRSFGVRMAPSMLASILIAAFFGMAPAQAAPQGSWLLPAGDLSQPGQDAETPQIAFAPDGTATAVWRRSNGINYIAQASTRPPGGSFGPPENLSATGRDAKFPRVAMGPDGTTTVVWERSNGPHDIVQARTRPPGGTFGPIEDLSADVHNSFQPEVAIGPDGTTAVAWFCFCSPGPTNIVKISLRPPGGPFGGPQGLSGGGGAGVRPDVAVGPGGMVVATWTKTLAADKRIQASVRPADGSFATPQTLSGSGEDSDYSRVAIGPGGSATAVWMEPDGQRTIESSTRPPGGSFGPVEELSAPSEATYSPKIATGIDGTTTAVWLIYDGSNFAAQASTRPAGGAFGTPETLSDPGRSAEALEVAAGPDGIATAIWGRSTVGGIIARSATRPSGLEPFGPPLSLSDSGQSAYSPDVGVGPDGSAIGVWDRYNGANTIVQQASTQPPEFTLNAAKTGTGSGTVGSAPAGIDCGTNCAENYPSFTKVTLTATPEPGSTFEGWGGACSDATGDTCELTMLEDLDAVATFRAVPKAKISKVKVSGPKKVKKGRKATYKVRVTNSGDATATGVRLKVKGRGISFNTSVGKIGPKKTRTVKVKLRFKKPGKVKATFKVTSKNAGGKTVKKKITVRK